VEGTGRERHVLGNDKHKKEAIKTTGYSSLDSTQETRGYRINIRHSRFRQLMTRSSDNNEMPI